MDEKIKQEYESKRFWVIGWGDGISGSGVFEKIDLCELLGKNEKQIEDFDIEIIKEFLLDAMFKKIKNVRISISRLTRENFTEKGFL